MAKKREKRQNHKNDTIKYKLRSELRKMESYGRSKKADMQKTKADREKLRADGATYSESLRINHSKEHIYSFSTMTNYQKEVGYFGDWLIKQGHKRISIEESREYIQPYIDYCIEQKLSSYALEDVVTEFDIQGLELDYSIIAWDADYRYSNGEWTYHSFKGTRWNNIVSEEKRLYLKNAYRVLLTRARQGMAIFVPYGSDDDITRKPEYYDNIYYYLKEIGIEEL